MTATSPLAPESFPDLPPIGGVRTATVAAGLRYQNRPDLFLAALDPGTTVAGTFTRSLCPSAPVDWCRSNIGSGSARALVCNSGNANAFTGRAGDASTRLTAETVAAALDIAPTEVFLASTGVIGEPLPDDRLVAGLAQLPGRLGDTGAGAWVDAADAIRTTDTFAKGSTAIATLDESDSSTLVGIAKGSGMIAPDMATMLAFVFTDVAIAPDLLQRALTDSVSRSYNRITVDSDTSTSDTVLVFATGAAGNAPITGSDDRRFERFAAALHDVNLDLAHQIVRDGEGATKFIEIAVRRAESDHAAAVVAASIANSPLVKTALAAADANWGRIVMAVGKAGQKADRDALSIWIGDELVAENGVRADGYSEDRATRHLRNDEVRITVALGVGDGAATVWTCDLTHGYIEINAGYRS